MTEAQIKHMVDRFLGWKLPEDFTPDAGIKYAPPHGCWSTRPSGTNLLDALQADAMVRYLIEGMPASSADVPAGASEEWLRSLIDEEHRKLTAGMNLIDAAHGEFIIKAAVNALRRLSPSADLLKAMSDARAIVNHGPNISYPSRQAAQNVRDAIARLLDCLGKEQQP